MSAPDPILDDIAGSLADLAKRLAAIEAAHEALTSTLSHERDVQRQSLLMLVRLLERQTDSLRRLEEKLGAPSQPAAPPPPPRRQAVVKGQVIVAKAKPKAKPAARPATAFAGDEIDHQISEAIGNISAMLKKKAPKRRKA